jgi:hypothetical protein
MNATLGPLLNRSQQETVMPIVYVHGVATRDFVSFEAMKPYLRRYISPILSSDPDNVYVDQVFWGNHAAKFRWKGASRPRSRLLGQGPASTTQQMASPALLAALLEKDVIDRVPQTSAAEGAGGSGLISGARPPASAATAARLSTLTNDEISDLLTELIYATEPDGRSAAELALVADTVARDPEVRVTLAAQPTAAAEAAFIVDEVRKRAADSRLVSMGSGPLSKLADRLSEALSRGKSAPAYAASILAAEVRPWLNDLASVFIGDVFEYLKNRGDASAPGDIPRLVLDGLEAAHRDKVKKNEPLVVITHSMGGQLVYDVLTHFIPEAPERSHLRIDFWCATASQVGLFEELKLFKLAEQSIGTPKRAPFPQSLGVWWNVWDSNDFISYTAKPIFDDVDDEAYDSGLSLVTAHSGYLRRPSFYRRLAARLADAAKSDWRTT